MDFDEIDKYMFQSKVQNNNIISTEKFFINLPLKERKGKYPSFSFHFNL